MGRRECTLVPKGALRGPHWVPELGAAGAAGSSSRCLAGTSRACGRACTCVRACACACGRDRGVGRGGGPAFTQVIPAVLVSVLSYVRVVVWSYRRLVVDGGGVSGLRSYGLVL